MNRVSFYFLTAVFFCGLIGLIGIALNYNDSQKFKEEVNLNCTNLDLERTANCFARRLEPNFNFKSTEDNPNRSVEDILKYGGDCYDYTLVYESWANELNVSSQIISYRLNSEVGHMFIMLNDLTGYCILDQLHPPTCR